VSDPRDAAVEAAVRALGDAMRDHQEKASGPSGPHIITPDPRCVGNLFDALAADPARARAVAAALVGGDPTAAGVRARNYARSIAAEDASGGYREIAGCGCEHCAALHSPDPADA
jgi:hypothetical protein